jgi:predicted nuclease of predicted toxin-antitoxin system
MKFKLDENLQQSAVQLFHADGYDAVTVIDQQLQGEDDSKVAGVCQQEGRTLVTLDMDFADIRTYPPKDYSGIIVLRPTVQSIPTVELLLRHVIGLLKVEDLHQRLWIVDDGKLRIRE